MPIPIVLEEAAYPVLVVVNAREHFTISLEDPSIQLTGAGTYKLDIVGRNGKSSQLEFVLR